MSKAEELANEYRNTMPAEVMKLWGADAADELRRLAAENEALKADAERYRWIRVNGEPDEGMNYRSDWTPEMYDAAIDSAMKENPNG